MHVPFIVSSPLLPGGARELDIPTNHADLIPTLLGLTGIDPDQALARLQSDHTDAHPLVGRDLSPAIRAAEPAAPTEPILFTTDDEISEGSATTKSPFGRVAKGLHRYSTVKQPNHLQTVIAEVDVDGEQHLVKFSRYYDNAQFWTVPGERDERLARSAHRHRHRARTRGVRALRPHAGPDRGAQPRPSQPRRRPLARPSAARCSSS